MSSIFVSLLANSTSYANELLVEKVCPVKISEQQIGILVFSKPWYHEGGENAAYLASDNATGIGIEIHFLANELGKMAAKQGQNNQCQRYRILQLRNSNALMNSNEQPVAIDVPQSLNSPFYDNNPLEFGYGTHYTPEDDQDKPWHQQHSRASDVAIYDTPFVSDAYGVEGQDIIVKFETCVVCQRETGFDKVLSCGFWGFKREYMGGMTEWAEPEAEPTRCVNKPSEQFINTLDKTTHLDYEYWLDWR